MGFVPKLCERASYKYHNVITSYNLHGTTTIGAIKAAVLYNLAEF